MTFARRDSIAAYALISVAWGFVFTVCSAFLFTFTFGDGEMRGAPLKFVRLGAFPGEISIDYGQLWLNVAFYSVFAWLGLRLLIRLRLPVWLAILAVVSGPVMTKLVMPIFLRTLYSPKVWSMFTIGVRILLARSISLGNFLCVLVSLFCFFYLWILVAKFIWARLRQGQGLSSIDL